MARSKNRAKRKGKSDETDGALDSRTQLVGNKGKKRSFATASSASRDSTSQQPPAKRYKRTAPRTKRHKHKSTVGAEAVREPVPFSTLQNSHFALGESETRNTMATSSLGNNRLRSGFYNPSSSNSNPRRMQRSASHPGTPEDSDRSTSPAPVVYDLDTEDDDGGITLNVQGNDSGPIEISSDEDNGNSVESGEEDQDESSDLEEGEEREDPPQQNGSRDVRMQDDSAGQPSGAPADDVHFIIDSTPSSHQVRLKDLTHLQLETQVRYAFWHLPRDQIDLSRLARCLHCQAEGHIDERCPQKTCSHCGAFGEHESVLCPKVKRCDHCRQPGHAHCTGMRNTTIPCDLCSVSGHSESACPLRHYNRVPVPSSEPMRLWITCCACASKSHLVGDCPKFASPYSARWSLKSLDPEQIVNLSLQTGAGKLEKEAQSRGLRPEGLKIKGRASQHYADSARQDSSDSDGLENFLSHPPRARNDRRQAPVQASRASDNYRPGEGGRYDRFAAPSGSDGYRPPRNNFYATDSFGRTRSRSPPRLDYRRGRSPSPGGPHDSYRSGGYATSRHSSPPLQRPAPGVSIRLPTRKGSNTSLKGNMPAGQGKLPPRPPPPNSNKRGGKNKNRK